MERETFAIVLSGPSGAGKSSLLQQTIKEMDDIKYSVSATTRPPREDEVDGVNYFFLSCAEFERQKRAGNFLEWAEVHGNLYGTPRDYILSCLREGQDVILDLDIQGAAAFRQRFEGALLVFVAPPSLQELSQRIYSRGTDAQREIEKRISNARRELKHIDDYDYFVLNDDFRRAVGDLKSIIRAERNRVQRLKIPVCLRRG